MSSRETRSRSKQRREEERPTPPTDSGVAGVSSTPATMKRLPPPPMSPSPSPFDGSIDTVLPQQTPSNPPTPTPSVAASRRTTSSTARLRRLEAEYEASLELAELDRQEARRRRAIIEKKIEIAREREKIELEAASEYDGNEDRERQYATSPRGLAPASAPREPQAPLACPSPLPPTGCVAIDNRVAPREPQAPLACPSPLPPTGCVAFDNRVAPREPQAPWACASPLPPPGSAAIGHRATVASRAPQLPQNLPPDGAAASRVAALRATAAAPQPAYRTAPPLPSAYGGECGDRTDPIVALAAEIKKLGERAPPPPPTPRHRDLPYFSGDRSEWMAFLASYRETNASGAYSRAENMTRLRAALTGTARERVDAILFTSGGDPEEVIECLQRVYGRPTDLIHVAIKKVTQSPPLTDDAPQSIDEFACKVRNCLRLVRHFDSAYLENPQLLSSVLSRLTPLLRSKYLDFAAQYEHSGQPHLEVLSDFLCREGDRAARFLVTSYEDAAVNHAHRAAPPHSARNNPAGRAAARPTGPPARPAGPPARPADQHAGAPYRAHAVDSSPSECAHCKNVHALAECQEFRELTTDDRWLVVKKAGLCFKCLGGRHQWGRCKKKSCGVSGCRRPHHKLLHADRRPTEGSSSSPPEEEVSVSACCAGDTHKHAFLKIVPVVVQGARGTYETYALLDDGSTISLIESHVADRVGAKGRRKPLQLYGVGGRVSGTSTSRQVTAKIRGRNEDTWHELTNARTVDNLGLGRQTVNEETLRSCTHLEELRGWLTYDEAKPTILVGQDNWHLLAAQEVREGRKNQPVASRTRLGWVMHGFRGATAPVANERACHLRTTADDEDEDLDRLVRGSFGIDSLGVAPRSPRIPTEERALDILRRTLAKRDGRYEVGLLWRHDDVALPATEQQALSRLRGIERKMAADADYAEMYRKHMQALLDSGYAEPCPPGPPQSRPIWYLPHFGVKNPNKPGKLRVVFDAAARVGGVCLNDELIAGPDLLQSLLGVLLRFREGAVAVTADIKEMFLRVGIREEDRDAQRFLWRNTPDEPPRRYRMRSLIFGAASSPCSALYVKNENARAATDDAKLSKMVETSFYMDDYIHSTDAAAHAAHLVGEMARIQAEAGFELRGWASNDTRALRPVRATDRDTGVIELAADEATQKTLGLTWDTEQDTLGFNLSLHRVTPEVASGRAIPTKRQTLSVVMSVFDPLGLLAPITTAAKVLLQRVWASGVGWDDPLPADVQEEWAQWLARLHTLRDLRLPRHYGEAVDAAGELHIFCDASSTAYAAAAYWRFPSDEGAARTTLIAGKSRVAPLRPVSIPRLELQAAVLAVRLGETLRNEHRCQITSTTYWSDSRTALTWIKADARRYKPFVAHRVAEIQDATRPAEWRWVPTKENPADIATRKPPADFDSNHWWFHGPAFLTSRPEEWPIESPPAPVQDPDDELKKEATYAASEAPHPALPDVRRFSSRLRLLRATARVLQFVAALKEKATTRRDTVAATKTIKRRKTRDPIAARPTPRNATPQHVPLPPHFVEAAEEMWVKRSQEESFTEERRLLTAGVRIDKGRLASLDPRLDEQGVLRAGGRLRAATCLSQVAREPIVLDARHSYVRLLIIEEHRRHIHAYNEAVVNELRQKYWIFNLRATVREVARSCLLCRIRKERPSMPPFGDLPAARFGYKCRPFTYTGVDYFGPMEVTIGRRREKRWGALFTCLTTRAVHLELAASLSADSMLLALRRMTARRGTPREIWSDNGTNFVGANKELTLAREEQERLAGAAEAEKIKWVFIPPGAPNMGGAWERLVGAVKRALAVTLHERAPKEEVLATLLVEAEHIVNSRPLTHVPAEPGEEEALTPNHFMIGTSSGAPVPCATSDRDLVGRATWRTAQRLADMFWGRWLREYVPTLAPRHQGADSSTDLAVGDIVFIADPTLPRNTWPRGRVSRVYPGPDGRVRVAEVQTAAGQLRRPARKLVQLQKAVVP